MAGRPQRSKLSNIIKPDVWHSQYKAMNSNQLMIEIRRLHSSPYFIADSPARLNYLTSELAIKARAEF